MSVAAAGARNASPAFTRLRADLARYRQDSWLVGPWWISERTFWAIAVFRVGQRIQEIRHRLLRRAWSVPYTCLLSLVQGLTGIELWPNTDIGPALRIHHGYGVVINAGSVLGANVTLRQGVTIGARRAGDTEFPVIGDEVEFGAYAQVLGGIRIGAGARIGAFSVVLHDVPDGATVVGAPARIVSVSGEA